VVPLLTPNGLRILAKCPLHYHFRQQHPQTGLSDEDLAVDVLLRETLRALHVKGGPQRLNLPSTLDLLTGLARQEGILDDAVLRTVRQAVAAYHRRLRQDWARMLASNETLHLQLKLGQATIALEAEIDRLDRTADQGIAATEFKTGQGPAPDEEALAADPGTTALHALVAAAYPAKRPVRVRQWWLRLDRVVEVELSETEYRRNLGVLPGPVQALVQGEIVARPGLHCEVCPFKYAGCPIYAHEVPPESPQSPAQTATSTRSWDFIDDDAEEAD
jgi:hypothetical protein